MKHIIFISSNEEDDEQISDDFGNPKTGDDTTILYLATALACICILIILLVQKRKSK